MRKLTLIRKKSFVASLMKVYVYLETEEASDLALKGLPTKKMGELKKNETITFDIPNEKVQLFVVFDKLFPQAFHTKFQIEAGDEDIILYTKARFSPFKGNPFSITKE